MSFEPPSTLEHAPLAPAPENQERLLNFEFRGNASEFFKIWIVNVLLTVVTLGIYSAWAKVRTRRYFYGNTFLDGASFDYHADPVKILIGRLILGAFGAAYLLSGYISPTFAGIVFLLFFLMFPWFFVNSMRFNLSNTSYRNIRFGFMRDYVGSYATFFAFVLVTVISCGLAFPLADQWRTKFLVTRARFGTSEFNFDSLTSKFYGIYVPAALIYVAGALSMVIIVALTTGSVGSAKGAPTGIGLVAVVIALYASLFLATCWVFYRKFDVMWSSTTLPDLKLQPRVSYGEVVVLFFQNALGVIFTLGLAYPWAKIRLAKYRLEHLSVLTTTAALASHLRSTDVSQNALGDAANDIWDLDIGI